MTCLIYFSCTANNSEILNKCVIKFGALSRECTYWGGKAFRVLRVILSNNKLIYLLFWFNQFYELKMFISTILNNWTMQILCPCNLVFSTIEQCNAINHRATSVFCLYGLISLYNSRYRVWFNLIRLQLI